MLGERPLSRLSEPVILVASAEFTLKSSPVRRTLEQRLIDDLRFALSRAGFDGFRVEKDAARLVVRGLGESKVGAQLCSRVFGVAYAAPALLLSASMEAVLQSIVNLASEGLGSGQSFAIRAHRSTSGPLSRRDVELKGGSEVLHALKNRGVTVDLEQPNVTIHVDLVGERAYVYGEKLQGPGGLPLSSQWKMLAVLDSGPLTLLAAYAMMRRGCLVELFIPLSHAIPTFAGEKQMKLAQNLRQFVTRPSYRAFTIDFDRLLGSDLNAQPQSIDPKRLVRLAAAKLAKEKRFKGIIFADVAGNIGTAETLGTSADLPVFTPLMGLQSGELVDMATLAGLPGAGLAQQGESPREFETLMVDLSKHLEGIQVDQLSL